MPIHSRWNIPIPKVSLPTWILGSPDPFAPLPSKLAFIDTADPGEHTITYQSFRLWSQRVGKGLLQNTAFNPGDRVLVCSANNIYYPALFLGIIMAGGVFTGTSPFATARELTYQIKDSGARFIMAGNDVIDRARQAAEEAGVDAANVYVFDKPEERMTEMEKMTEMKKMKTMEKSEKTANNSTSVAGAGLSNPPGGCSHWLDFLEPASDVADWAWFEPADPENTLCCLNYSSGTTGLPKGVATSHANYVANGTAATHIVSLDPARSPISSETISLCILPLSHVFSQVYYMVTLPRLRATVCVSPPPFSPVRMLKDIERHRVTHMVVAPPILNFLAKTAAVSAAPAADLSSLRSVFSGAAPLAKGIAQKVEALCPPGLLSVREGWGMTELTCTALQWAPDNMAPEPNSVGELSPNCRAKLMTIPDVHNPGDVIPPQPLHRTEITAVHTRGELWITGPSVMMGYWQNPAATAAVVAVDADGTRWLRTGDVAYVGGQQGVEMAATTTTTAKATAYDRPGQLFFVVDRVKELIKFRGNQVAPAELEGLLMERADVSDAGVVGVMVDGEEVPRAYVVRAEGAGMPEHEREMAKWVAERVAKYKQLRGGIKFVDSIPKTASGKILRGILRQQAKREVGDDGVPSPRLS